jgi:ornithine cyclodeaminase
VFGIRTLRLYDTDPAATARLVRNLARLAMPGLAVIPCGGTADAVRGADIVTTVTADKRHAVILTPEMIAPGMHLNALGGDCPGKTELHHAILRRPDTRVVVEYTPQTRVEGEIQQLEPDFPVIELADVIRGTQPGRSAPDQVTVFDSVGFALEDLAVLRYLHRLVDDMHVMQTIDLVPVLDDPKDLFGALGARIAAARANERARVSA